MMTQAELMLWLNAPTFCAMIDRADAMADVIERGLVDIIIDDEIISSLKTTATAPALLMLPPAQA